jgi:hypothetical protein
MAFATKPGRFYRLYSFSRRFFRLHLKTSDGPWPTTTP